MPESLSALIARHAGPGEIVWIGVRPARRAPVVALRAVQITPAGLVGDRRERPGVRAVTLVQAEHLPVVRALARAPAAGFAELRRNIAVAGLNLMALRGAEIAIGAVRLRITGPCAPCSRMEEALGPGGYTALRGHGGVTAKVVSPGRVALGDPVRPCAGISGAAVGER